MIQQLDEQSLHFIDRSFYSKVEMGHPSDFIFDGYAKGKSNDEILELIHSQLNSPEISTLQFKLAEKSVYNELLDWYGLKAQTRREHLPSLVFYAIHQIEEEDEKMAVRLENLYHELKKNKLEHIAGPLLEKLSTFYKNTPLEAVYNHLLEKYTAIEALNDNVRRVFEHLNGKLSVFCKNGDTPETVKSMIQDFKQIRNWAEKHPNNVTATYRDLSKLILIIACQQDQLLKDSVFNLKGFIQKCREQIESFEFGIERYFLQNIFVQLELLYQCDQLDKNDLVQSFKSISERQRNAYNFGFPTEYYRKIQRHIYHIDTENNCKLIQFYNWKDYGVNQLMMNASNILSQNRDSYVTN